MHASRKILLKHFGARAAEYCDEISHGKLTDDQQADGEAVQEPVSRTGHLFVDMRIIESNWLGRDLSLAVRELHPSPALDMQ